MATSLFTFLSFFFVCYRIEFDGHGLAITEAEKLFLFSEEKNIFDSQT